MTMASRQQLPSARCTFVHSKISIFEVRSSQVRLKWSAWVHKSVCAPAARPLATISILRTLTKSRTPIQVQVVERYPSPPAPSLAPLRGKYRQTARLWVADRRNEHALRACPAAIVRQAVIKQVTARAAELPRVDQRPATAEAVREIPITLAADSTQIPLLREAKRKRQHTPVEKEVKSESQPPAAPAESTIPAFYFPQGRPLAKQENEKALQAVEAVFAEHPGEQIPKKEFGQVAKAAGLSFYWKGALFYAAGGEKNGSVGLTQFRALWKKLTGSQHDEASRFVKLLSRSGAPFLTPEDWAPLIQDIVEDHPGLQFLKDHQEFHSRYIHTVIARIFYVVNRSWSGRITAQELRRSNFFKVLNILEQEEDINLVLDYFSYEHFYVIYCKFWELDTNHTLQITKEDLARYGDHALSGKVIDRIFSGCVTRGDSAKKGIMTYPEFVWFILSEEDKRNPTSIEYWFRCLDVDGDGVLSYYEMEHFYEEQVQRMASLNIDYMPFETCLCQLIDMVKPKEEKAIRLSDLKNCKLVNHFIDTFTNIHKFLAFERNGPCDMYRGEDGEEGAEPSDWDKFAAQEYEMLIAEEGANDEETGSIDEE